jgi:excisionase family DNA binding protein
MAITVTMQKASEESGLSLRTIQYAISRGELRSVTVGRRRLIPADALQRFLLGRGAGKRQPHRTGGKPCAC